MTDNTTPPIVVNPSALRSIATAVLRQAITAGGAYLVTHGLLTQGQADAAVPEVIGLAMVTGSAAWSWWKANHTHTQLASMAASPAVPDSVAKLATPATGA